jgi:hypothetical protein
MGDAKAGPVRLSFNPQLRVEFQGATVTFDAGLVLLRDIPRTRVLELTVPATPLPRVARPRSC